MAEDTVKQEPTPGQKLKDLMSAKFEPTPGPLTPEQIAAKAKQTMDVIQEKHTTKPLDPQEVLRAAGENRLHSDPGAKVLATPDMDKATFDKQRQPGSTG